jgi:hypothetical protein
MNQDDFIAIVFPLCMGIFARVRLRGLKGLQQKTASWIAAEGVMLEITAEKWGRWRRAHARYEFYTPSPQVGTRICPEGCEDSDPDVYLEKYPKGGGIVVYYDPSDPRDCYLELPEVRIVNLWSALSAICFTFPVIYCLWLVFLR